MNRTIFVRMLRERGSSVYLFLNNFNAQRPDDSIIDKCLIAQEEFSSIVAKAFDWSKTPEGFNYWYKVAYPNNRCFPMTH